MNVSDQGRRLIEQREGCRLTAYQDSVGVWTIGYGHTKGVQPGDVITQEKADELLKVDLRWVEEALANVTVPLEQNQYDALASFTFNVGAGAFENSTMLRLLNAGDYTGAANQFDRWHIPEGIISRRNAEKAQFLGTDYEPRIPP